MLGRRPACRRCSWCWRCAYTLTSRVLRPPPAAERRETPDPVRPDAV